MLDEVETNVADLKTTDIYRSRLGADVQELPATTRQISTHIADLDRDTRRAINSIKEGAGREYSKYRVQKAGGERPRPSVRGCGGRVALRLRLVHSVQGRVVAESTVGTEALPKLNVHA